MRTPRSAALRRFALPLALVAGGAAAAGTVAATQGQADAATSVTACFRNATGSAYVGKPIHLNAWSNGAWRTIRSGSTGANGCGTFYGTPSGSYLAVHAAYATGNGEVGIAQYSGWAPHVANPGSGNGFVGTGTVRLTSCTRGWAITICPA